MRKGDVAVVDARAHISMVDGLKIGGAKIAFFEHNDARALDEVLSAHTGTRRLIFVDGLYSMDGDMADLPALLDVAESHGVGHLRGRGAFDPLLRPERAAAWSNTSARARASACSTARCRRRSPAAAALRPRSTDLIEYLRFYSNTYGFTCALPPSVVAAASAVIDVMQTETWRRAQLWENAAYFRTQLQSLGINTGHLDQLRRADRGRRGPRAALRARPSSCATHGLFVTPVDYPTVPLDQARFRASVTALAHARGAGRGAADHRGRVRAGRCGPRACCTRGRSDSRRARHRRLLRARCRHGGAPRRPRSSRVCGQPARHG